MNRLGRMLFGERTSEVVTGADPALIPDPPPPEPLTPFLRCPDCESLDFTRICTIVGIRDTVSVERGARYCCENCASLWSISPSGVRRANARAIPVTMQPPKPRELVDGEEPRKAQPLRDDQPIPRPRPRP